MTSFYLKKIQIIILSMLFLYTSNFLHVHAEPGIEWETLVGGPLFFHWGTGVDQTFDGGYIAVGYVDSSGTGGGGFHKIYLAKISPTGRIEWSKSIGDASKETSGTFVQQTKDGGYIIAGSIDQMGWETPTSVYLVKTDSQGNIVWTKTFGESIANGNSVYQTKDGGFIFAAGSNLYKTDTNGNQQWSKTYSDNVMHAHQTRDGGYILVTGNQAIKLNTTGTPIWSSNLGVNANSVQETQDGGCIAVGGLSLVKVSSSGHIEWTKSFGGTGNNWGNSVQETYDGGYIIAGTTRTDDNIDVYIVRTDGNGILEWEKKIGATEVARGDYGYHVELCDDGGYIVVGASDKAGLNGVSDVYLIKIAPDTVPPPKPSEFVLSDLLVLPSEVEIGQNVSVSVKVSNIGEKAGSHTVELRLDSTLVNSQSVYLDGGDFTTITFVISSEISDIHTVSVDSLIGSFRVKGPAEPEPQPTPEPVTPDSPHDVAAVAQTSEVSVVVPGTLVNIDVYIDNLGNETETFDVTCYYGNEEISTVRIEELEAHTRVILLFIWDTSEIEYDRYLIKAWADSSEEISEIFEDNNWCTQNLPIRVVPSSAEIPTSITCFSRGTEYNIDDEVTIEGSITPSVGNARVLLTFYYQEKDEIIKSHTRDRYTRITNSNGEYYFTFIPEDNDFFEDNGNGVYYVSASWEGITPYLGSSSANFTIWIKEKSWFNLPCFIATATFGSELSSEVQFLRGFRDNIVLSTYSGSNFMQVFNSFYYSFSPSVAKVIASNEAIRAGMRVLLYPLIGILHLSSSAFSLFSFLPEVGVLVAGFVASSLIALVYFTPGVLLLGYFKKYRPSVIVTRTFCMFWAGSIILMAFAWISRSSLFMMMSTGSFVLVTMGLTSLVTLRLVARALHLRAR
jgi:hypothetical protein